MVWLLFLYFFYKSRISEGASTNVVAPFFLYFSTNQEYQKELQQMLWLLFLSGNLGRGSPKAH